MLTVSTVAALGISLMKGNSRSCVVCFCAEEKDESEKGRKRQENR